MTYFPRNYSDYKEPVRVATVSDIDLASPGATIDGVTMASGDRVYVRAQSDAVENGIYTWLGATTPMVRTLDANDSRKVTAGLVVPVEEGTTNADTLWMITAAGTLDTDALLDEKLEVGSPFVRDEAPVLTTLRNGNIIKPATVYGWDDPTEVAGPLGPGGPANNSTRYLTWSPDGRYLGVTFSGGTDNLKVYERLGTTFTEMSQPTGVTNYTSGEGVAWSPDGRILAVGYDGSGGGIRFYTGLGSQLVALDTPFVVDDVPVGVEYRGLDWSPSGRFLATTCEAVVGQEVYEQIEPQLFQKIVLTELASTAGQGRTGPAWSPDERFLAYGHGGSGDKFTILRRVGREFFKISLSGQTLPSSDARQPAWHPSGKYVAVSEGSSPYIHVYKREGFTFTRLDNPAILPPGSAGVTQWSPDGRYLSVPHASSPFLTVYELNDDTLTKVEKEPTFSSAQSVARWSPDGKYFASGPTVRVYQTGGAIPEGIPAPIIIPD